MKIKYLILLTTYTLSLNVQSEIRLSETKNLYNIFKDEYKHLSPTLGFVALKSNLIHNIRFYGTLGPKKDGFLCHYLVTNPHKNFVNKSNTDCPLDYTSTIIQHLFPSAEGSALSLAGREDDFFKKINLKEIAYLLIAYEKAKSLDDSERKDLFNKIFENWLGVNSKKGSKEENSSNLLLGNRTGQQARNFKTKFSQIVGNII